MLCSSCENSRIASGWFSRDDLRESQSTKNQLTEVNCQSGSRDFNFLKRPATLDHPTFPNIFKLFRLFLQSLASISARSSNTPDLCGMQLTHSIFPNENNKRKSVTKLVNERPTTEGHISFTTSCVLRATPSAPSPTRMFNREAAKTQVTRNGRSPPPPPCLLSPACEVGWLGPCFRTGQQTQEPRRTNDHQLRQLRPPSSSVETNQSNPREVRFLARLAVTTTTPSL